MKFASGLMAALVMITLAYAEDSKIASDLKSLQRNGPVDVIVQYRQPPTDLNHKKILNLGGLLHRTLDIIQAAHYAIPSAAIQDLANDPEVAFISPDRAVKPSLDIADAAINGTVAAQYGYDGSGVGVAVIDSGIGAHTDLNGGVFAAQSFIGGGTDDGYGHGTHVAGIIAGSGYDSTGNHFFRMFRGIAPEADLINLRALDSNGSGTDSSVISAIQAAISMKNRYNIRVINLSLGRPVYESYRKDPLCQAVEQAWKAGIVVVVAAGNAGRDNSAGTSGYATIASPANDPYVITVGAMKTEGTATRSDDLIASYSSKGPTLYDHIVKPDIVAPGNRIISLRARNASLAQTYPQILIAMKIYQDLNRTSASPDYFELSGTSMAAPMVSGAVALLLQKYPQLTPDKVKARLMKTASKSFPAYSVATDPVSGATYSSQYDIFTVGAGYLDVAAALNNSDNAAGAALSPVAVYANGNVTLSFDPNAVWGTSVVWGSTVVWGSSVFVNSTSNLWGRSVVWGSSSTQGFSMVWGSSVVWGSSNQAASESAGVAVNGEN